MTLFWVKSSIILCKLAQMFFFASSKNKIIFNFVIFVATSFLFNYKIFKFFVTKSLGLGPES